MRDERAERSSAASERSRRARALFQRPAVARLLEPCGWAAALAIALARADSSARHPLLAMAASFLVLRLCADTAQNLAAAPRLQEAAYDERRIRRALALAKVVLALAAAIAVQLLVLAGARAFAEPLLAVAGSRSRLLLGLAVVLASYAIPTPVLRRHRGVPIARPNLGPAAGACAFAAAAAWVTPDAPSLAGAAAACIVAGNVVVGGWIRVRAAADRLHSPLFVLSDADVRHGTRSGPEEAAVLLREGSALAPFLLFPVLPALFVAFDPAAAGSAAAAVLAAFAAVLPPVLFDARKGGPRFALASLSTASVLATSYAVGSPRHGVLLETAVLVAAFPLASRLLARGLALRLLCAALVLVVLRLMPAIAHSRVPIAELVFAAGVALAAMPAALRDDERHPS